MNATPLYHLLSLVVKNTDAKTVRALLDKILVVEGPAKARILRNTELWMWDNDYDMEFYSDECECIAPEQMGLLPGQEVRVRFQMYGVRK